MPLRDSIKDGPSERALRVAEPVLPVSSREGEQLQLDQLTLQVGEFISRRAADHKQEAIQRHRKLEKTLTAIFPKEAIAVAREALLGEKLDLHQNSRSAIGSSMEGPLTARPPTSSQGAIPRTPNTGRTSSTPAAFRLPAFRRPPTVEPREGCPSPAPGLGMRSIRSTVPITPTHLQHNRGEHSSAAAGCGGTHEASVPSWVPNLSALRGFSESQFASLQRWAESSFDDALLFDAKQSQASCAAQAKGSFKQYFETHHVPSKVLVSSVCFILDEIMATVTGFDTLWPRMREVLYRAIYVDEKAPATQTQSALSPAGKLKHPECDQLHDSVEGTFHGEVGPNEPSSAPMPAVFGEGNRNAPNFSRGEGREHHHVEQRVAAPLSAMSKAVTAGHPQRGGSSHAALAKPFVDFRHMLSGSPMISEKCMELFRDIDKLKDELDGFRAIHEKQLLISDMTVRSSGKVIIQMMFTAWRAVVTRRKQRESSVDKFAISRLETATKAVAFLRWRRYIVQLQRNRLRDANANATSAAQMQAEEQMSAVQTLELKLQNTQRQHRLDLAREEEMRKSLISNQKIEVMEMRTVQDQKDDIILMQEKNCRRWERIAKLHRAGVRAAPPKALVVMAKKLRDVEEELFRHGQNKARLVSARGLLEKFLITWVNGELEAGKSRVKPISNTMADLRDGDVYIALVRALRKSQTSLVKLAGDMDPFATLLTIIYVNTAQGLFPPLRVTCGFYMKFFTPEHVGMVAHPLGGLWILSTLFVAKALQTGSTAFVPYAELSQPDAHVTPPYYLALMDGVRFIQEQREALAQQRAEEGGTGNRKSTTTIASNRVVVTTPPKVTASVTQKTAIRSPSVSPKPKSLAPPAISGGARPQSPGLDAAEEEDWSDDSSDNDAYFGSRTDDDDSSDDSSASSEVVAVPSLSRISFNSDKQHQQRKLSVESKAGGLGGDGCPPRRKLPPCPKELVGLGIKGLVELLTSEESNNTKWIGLARVITSLILRYRVLDLDGRSNVPDTQRGSIGSSDPLSMTNHKLPFADGGPLGRRSSSIAVASSQPEADKPLVIDGPQGVVQHRRSSVKFTGGADENNGDPV